MPLELIAFHRRPKSFDYMFWKYEINRFGLIRATGANQRVADRPRLPSLILKHEASVNSFEVVAVP